MQQPPTVQEVVNRIADATELLTNTIDIQQSEINKLTDDRNKLADELNAAISEKKTLLHRYKMLKVHEQLNKTDDEIQEDIVEYIETLQNAQKEAVTALSSKVTEKVLSLMRIGLCGICRAKRSDTILEPCGHKLCWDCWQEKLKMNNAPRCFHPNCATSMVTALRERES